ncbi:MAG: hypothetical protein AABZ60_17805 [Planctomycetota bacterium]
MTENIQEPSLLKKLFKIFLVFLLGFIVLLLYLSYQRSQRVEQILQEFKQSGYATSLKEINEKYLLPSSTDNASLVIENALTKLKEPEQKEDPNSKEKKEYIINVSNTLIQPLSPGESLSEEAKTAIAKHLAQNEDAFKILRQGLAMKQFRYCPDYTLGFNAKIPNLLGMRKITNLLMLKTLFHLENGESEEAIQSILEGFALSHSFSNDPMLIMYMIQTALIRANIESLEHLLNRMDISEKNNLEFSSLLQSLEEPESLGHSLETELCTGLDSFNQLALSPGGKISYLSGAVENDRIFYLERMKTVIDNNYAPLQDRAKGIQDLSNMESEIENSSNLFHSITQMLMPSFHKICATGLERIMILRNAQVALAVERYRLANQKLPEQLSELVPLYIKEELLLDLFDHKSIRYKKLSKGYLVYSVGEDTKDNEGKKKEKDKPYDLVFTVNR